MESESSRSVVYEEQTDTNVEYDVSSDDRMWGILTHASAFVGFIVPFGNIFAPRMIWIRKKEESQFVNENGKQALNFQITWTILLAIVGLTFQISVVLGLLLVPVIGLAWLVLVVLATVRASEQKVYDYPLTIDLIS